MADPTPNLLDALDELVHLPEPQRQQRLDQLDLSDADRSRLASWLAYQSGGGGSGSDGLDTLPGPLRQVRRLLPGSAGSDEPPPPADDSGGGANVTPDLAASIEAAAPPPHVPGYEVLGPLGHGGMATVWRARQLATGREVALKVVSPWLLASPPARARFERELRLASRLQHPDVARVYDGGSANGVCYYAMELVEGRHLDEYVREHKLTQRQILSLVRDVCRAVQHAHQKGVIHRDLKPSNILVDADGRPRVLDFGLARAIEEGTDDRATLTLEGQLAGTLAFMSPEQAAGRTDLLDVRADVYGLGATLYLLLTGHPPHDTAGPRNEVLRRIAEQDVRRPRQFCRDIGSELEALLLKALAREPEDRYGSAGEFANDLENYLAGDPISARAAGAAYRLRKLARKYKAAVAVGATMLALLISGTISTSIGMVRATASRRRAEAAETLAINQKNAAERARAAAEREAKRAHALNLFAQAILTSAGDGAEGRGSEVRVVDLLKGADHWIWDDLVNEPDAEIDARLTLGRTYALLGLPDESLSNINRAYMLARKTYGEESEQALDAAEKLVTTAPRSEQAESLARKTYAAARQVLGDRHQVTLNAACALSQVLRRPGKWPEAEAVCRDALGYLPGRDESGESTLHRIALMDMLARILYDQGKFVEAETFFRRNYALAKESPRIDTVAAFRIRSALAQAVATRGELDEAKEIREQLVADERRRLGDTHPLTLRDIQDLEHLLEKMANYDEALALQQRRLVTDRQTGRAETGEHLEELYKAGHLLARLGRTEEAMRTLQDAIAGFHEKSGARNTALDDWWRSSVLQLGIGPEEQWRGAGVRAQVGCAIDEYLFEHPSTSYALTEVDLHALRFRLERWDTAAVANAGGAAALEALRRLTPVAEGSLADLRNLPDPPPGVYRMSLAVVRAGLPKPDAQKSWLLFCPWDLAAYPLWSSMWGDTTADLSQWSALIAKEPGERRPVGALALRDILTPHAGSGRREVLFGLVATASVDLPAGTYRFVMTNDDGARLWVDDRLLIDDWKWHAPERHEAATDLAGGPHRLRVEFFNWAAGFKLWLQARPG